MADAVPEKELDQDGIAIQTYDTKVLITVPSEGFGEQILRYARSLLHNVGVGTFCAAPDPGETVRGRLQDEFQVEIGLADPSMDAYQGIVVAGCEGSHPFAQESHVLELLRDADGAGKLIAGWGNALEVLARAEVLEGRRVTGSPELAGLAMQAGAKYTGRDVESSQNLVTARDEAGGVRFGQALVEQIRIR